MSSSLNYEPIGIDRFARFDQSSSRLRIANHEHAPCAICAFIYCLKNFDIEAAEIIRRAQFEKCEVMVDLGQRCGRPITETVTEPFTPKAFKIRCCDQCAANFREQGYGWIKPSEVTA